VGRKNTEKTLSYFMKKLTGFIKKVKFYTLLVVLIISCNQKKESELVWDVTFPVIGSQSSPRSCDLNNDGILDFVMGAGKNEFEYSEQGILAIDGSNGTLIWAHPAGDQVYGSATFCDVNGDGTPDIFIGGRGPHLRGIDGKSGNLLWKFDHEKYTNHPVLKYARFNFNNSILIPDVNNDGIPELLTNNGGNAEAEPYESTKRYPGVLMVIDPTNGNVLAADTMPDGKETYLSPLLLSQPQSDEHQVLFGTGGETISGNLYLVNLSDLLKNDLSSSIAIASEKGHGFIAPPSLADLNQDGWYDIIAISHSSTVTAIDGKTLYPIWKRTIPGTESSNSFAVGQFTDDDVLDVFTFVSKGVWPDNKGSVQVMIDGKTGDIAYLDSIGCTGFSSPVAYDLNKDGIDEVIISINEYDCNRNLAENTSFPVENKLLIIDFEAGATHTLDQTQGFKNIFSTPWIGDIDRDGYLDLVHCQYFSHSDVLSFLGMRVKRIDLPIKMREPPVWGAFMGSEGDGTYKIK
jgi:outer membrane protein assembly factor BamB